MKVIMQTDEDSISIKMVDIVNHNVIAHNRYILMMTESESYQWADLRDMIVLSEVHETIEHAINWIDAGEDVDVYDVSETQPIIDVLTNG